MLLERAGQPVPVDVLTDALWGAQPVPRAGQKLQVHAHRLRRLLGEPERLSFTGGGYRLRVLPGELDAQRFETLVAEAVRATGREPRGTAQSLREALALWQGTPLGDLEVPVLADWAHRLSECRLTALETLYQAELAAGREAEVAGELAGLVRAHPLRERFHGLLMTALYRAGRPADALAAYRAAREVLASELGLEPGPALRGLQRRMLAGAPVGPDGGTPAGACPPAQLPVRVRGFTGREAELAELDRLLLAGGPGAVAVVAGTAGAGKTALAVHWAHRARARFPDGQLYVDLGGYGPGRPAGPEEALAGLLRGLGVDGAAMPPGRDERAARFRSLVDRRRLLVLLDNARSAEQVRPLLPGGTSCVTLVTSRDALAGLVAREGAHRICLDRLPAGDARALLRALAGERAAAEPAAAGALAERCARLPLALRVAAELVRSRPAGGVAALAAELARAEEALDLLDAGGDPRSAVRSVFWWSYRVLDPAAARVFRLLGLLPGEGADVRAVAALAGSGPRETRRVLGALLRAHLVERTAAGRFRVHGLLRAYAAELAGAAGEREAALERLRDHDRAAAAGADAGVPGGYGRVTGVCRGEAFRWPGGGRAAVLAAARDAGA
ncbi:AfsR/SARP family transcriptional regulator [Streptomyces sp. 7-21]|nr:AfsR/SARP family transcriptional regulator [Streptomyces sp. 7-21]